MEFGRFSISRTYYYSMRDEIPALHRFPFVRGDSKRHKNYTVSAAQHAINVDTGIHIMVPWYKQRN